MIALQFFFTVISATVFAIGGLQFWRVYRNINLGKQDYTADDNLLARLRNVLLIAFGQKKMFDRPIVGFLHLSLYVAFLVTQIELIEIMIDGVFGTHRFFLPFIGGVYWYIISFIELLSVLALVATIAFLSRRFYLKLRRFQQPELRGFPMIDAAVILLSEIVLIACIFTMNSADLALQHRGIEGFHHTGNFLFSQFFMGAWSWCSDGGLMIIERLGWWGHFAGVMALVVYLPYSKHLHIFLAFFNTFYAKLGSRGALSDMPAIQREVALMFSDNPYATPDEPQPEITKFGASDVFDLSWKSLLDAYTCTECGRCTSVCPANTTGKILSPRKVMMDVRDRLQEVGSRLDSNDLTYVKKEMRAQTTQLTPENYDDGKSLLDYISDEELRACTTCNACVEACPILINPLDIIMEIRRYKILDQADSPEAWNSMFTNIDNNRAPWQFSPDDRDKWATEM